MLEPTTHPLEYYAHPGLMTDPGEQVGLLEGLPPEIPALCQVVQGNLLHIFWAERYGVELSEVRKQEAEIRSVAGMLTRIRSVDDCPLTIPRPLEERLVGNCRDFTTMLCALLQHRGIPARARCGFGTYFERGKYVDHWVCEYWKAKEGRWVMVDAQLDEFQCQALQIAFDPHDVPHDQFLTGGKAWGLCRAGQADPEHFGIFDMWGLWFIRGNLVRDLAALNKMELLPWDCWGLIDKDEETLTPDDMALLDHVAALTQADNEVFAEVRAIYENEDRLRVPSVIRSYTASGIRTVDVTDEKQIR
jgi:hypothetical protein